MFGLRPGSLDGRSSSSRRFGRHLLSAYLLDPVQERLVALMGPLTIVYARYWPRYWPWSGPGSMDTSGGLGCGSLRTVLYRAEDVRPLQVHVGSPPDAP
jgi:hypothetical protein